MKVNVQIENEKRALRDVPDGGLFWCGGTLYQKPKITGCVETSQGGKLVLNLEQGILTAFCNDDTKIIFEPRPMQVCLTK